MADIKIAYASSTALTISLASIADNGARECDHVNNESNLYMDILVQLEIKLATGTPGGEEAIYIWAYGAENAGDFTDNATGSDAAITLRDPHNFKLVGIINTPDSGGLTYKSNPMSISQAFGGILPREWGIVVENKTSVTFSSTEGDHSKHFTGVYYTG